MSWLCRAQTPLVLALDAYSRTRHVVMWTHAAAALKRLRSGSGNNTKKVKVAHTRLLSVGFRS